MTHPFLQSKLFGLLIHSWTTDPSRHPLPCKDFGFSRTIHQDISLTWLCTQVVAWRTSYRFLAWTCHWVPTGGVSCRPSGWLPRSSTYCFLPTQPNLLPHHAKHHIIQRWACTLGALYSSNRYGRLQTLPIWHPTAGNRRPVFLSSTDDPASTRLQLVDENEMNEPVPSSDINAAPTPSTQVWTRLEYMDLIFESCQIWHFLHFFQGPKIEKGFHKQHAFPNCRPLDRDLGSGKQDFRIPSSLAFAGISWFYLNLTQP